MMVADFADTQVDCVSSLDAWIFARAGAGTRTDGFSVSVFYRQRLRKALNLIAAPNQREFITKADGFEAHCALVADHSRIVTVLWKIMMTNN